MTEPIQPSDLHFRLQDALGALRDVRRTITEVSRDAAALDVDELGDALTPADALGRTRTGLTGIMRTLDAADAFDSAMASLSRSTREPQPRSRGRKTAVSSYP